LDMADKKYQVFVSSTFRDLVEERQDAIRNILDLNHIPAGMELFPATDVEQLEYIKKVIDECDYYLLIVGGRYGSLDAEGISFTEREYDYAVEAGKFVIALVHGAPGSLPLDNSEVDPKLAAALASFKTKVMDGRLVKTWKNRQDLEIVVIKSLMHAFKAFAQTGWIRGDAAATSDIIEQSNALLHENRRLKEELAKLTETAQPKFENLAGLDDEFNIRYEVRISVDFGLPEFRPKTDLLTWRDIFLQVAAKIGSPKRDSIIPAAIAEALKESHGEENFSSLNETDKARIKAQLTALGLILVYGDKTARGGTEELLALTDAGRSLYHELIVVRRSNES